MDKRKKILIGGVVGLILLVIFEIILLTTPVLEGSNYRYSKEGITSKIKFSQNTYKMVSSYQGETEVDVGFYYCITNDLIIGNRDARRISVFAIEIGEYRFTSVGAIISQIISILALMADICVFVWVDEERSIKNKRRKRKKY